MFPHTLKNEAPGGRKYKPNCFKINQNGSKMGPEAPSERCWEQGCEKERKKGPCTKLPISVVDGNGRQGAAEGRPLLRFGKPPALPRRARRGHDPPPCDPPARPTSLGLSNGAGPAAQL